MENYKNFCILVFITVTIVWVKSTVQANNELCYICDGSIANTYNSSNNISKSEYNLENINSSDLQTCYRHGAYSVFCYPIPKKKTQKNAPGQDCKTHLSIMPPKATQDKCDVKILDKTGKLQDKLTIHQNLSITSTNGSWYVLPKKDNSNLYYTIAKRNPSKLQFEGKKLQLRFIM